MSILTLALETDKEIIGEYVANKSEIAATLFVRKYQRFVYSTAYRYLQSFDDADDAAQEVFIKAFNNLHRFRGDSSIKTWLYKITRNVSTSMIRKKRIYSLFKRIDDDSNFDIASNEKTPDLNIENKEMTDKLLKAIEKLPSKQRETFALRYFEDMKYEDISKLLGTSIGGLKANYYQAVQKISKILKDE